MNNRQIALVIVGILLTLPIQAQESIGTEHQHEHELPNAVLAQDQHDEHEHPEPGDEDHGVHRHEGDAEHDHGTAPHAEDKDGHDHLEQEGEDHDAHRHESHEDHDHNTDSHAANQDDHDHEEHAEHGIHEEHGADADHDHDESAKADHHDHDHGQKDSHSKGAKESDDGHEHDHEEASAALLTPDQMVLADIRVEPLKARTIAYQLYAPGEILSNGYTSYRVSPRVASVVLQRHVALGDHVEQGQPLVTLFSEKFAQAQAEYRSALPEWQRVRKLGRQTVGEKRYINAKSNLEAVQATLQAYGLSPADLKLLANQKMGALGEYTLRAKIDGAVLADDFEQGQRIEAGARLITLADESQLWVEAHLPSNRTLTLGSNTQADVVAGDVRVSATVSQEAHTIDPVTRTRTIRLLVDNPEHRLHPGQFADVFFRFNTEKPVLAVPETALMRSADGDWTVFVEDHPGEFQPIEVGFGRALGQFREISGVKPGTNIVMEGAFFVASQIAKGGFDPHNH